MNATLKSKFFTAISVLFLATSLFSCDSDEPAIRASDDFFPLTENSHWKYKYRHFFTDPDGNSKPYYTIVNTMRVQGDTTVENKTYKKFVNDIGGLARIVRQEGSRYFGRIHGMYGGFSHEYMFLDTTVPLNGTWSYLQDEGIPKIEYRVKALHARHSINGNLFWDVTEVEVTYYTMNGATLEPRLTTRHYYAKGVGEIYAYYPAHASGRYSDLDISLVK
jgi:hypothetical protein